MQATAVTFHVEVTPPTRTFLRRSVVRRNHGKPFKPEREWRVQRWTLDAAGRAVEVGPMLVSVMRESELATSRGRHRAATTLRAMRQQARA